MKQIFSALPFIYILALAAGCTTPTQNVYTESGVGREAVVEYGTILSMRKITIQPKDTDGGVLAGTLLGGIAGSTVGNDTGNTLATIGGALAGAAVGAVAEKEISKREGIEYTIALHNGKVLAIAQNIGKDDAPLTVGQHVVIHTDKKDKIPYRRVLPADALPE